MSLRALVVMLAALGPASCRAGHGSSPASSTAASPQEPLAVLRELERGIEAGTATEADRETAYETLRTLDDDNTAEYAFARAAVAGRLAELRGVGAGKLVTEAERFARLALQRDANYDDGAATRMLGTLYVMAPRRLVEHGDAEDGLSMLERLVQERPDDPRNHLRVAEAFIALDDPEPALPFLCEAQDKRALLSDGDQRLLDTLASAFDGGPELACD